MIPCEHQRASDSLFPPGSPDSLPPSPTRPPAAYLPVCEKPDQPGAPAGAAASASAEAPAPFVPWSQQPQEIPVVRSPRRESPPPIMSVGGGVRRSTPMEDEDEKVHLNKLPDTPL